METTTGSDSKSLCIDFDDPVFGREVCTECLLQFALNNLHFAMKTHSPVALSSWGPFPLHALTSVAGSDYRQIHERTTLPPAESRPRPSSERPERIRGGRLTAVVSIFHRMNLPGPHLPRLGFFCARMHVRRVRFRGSEVYLLPFPRLQSHV